MMKLLFFERARSKLGVTEPSGKSIVYSTETVLKWAGLESGLGLLDKFLVGDFVLK